MARIPNNPHDALFRVLFEDPKRADPLIREHLPPEVANLLSDDPMQMRPGSWIDSGLAGHQADVLYEGRLRNGEPVAIYVLLEHKSWPDEDLPFQILRYQLRIWEGYRKGAIGNGEGLKKPPPIVPLVFYHGQQRWPYPLTVAGVVNVPELDRFTPSSEPVLRDLGSFESEELSKDVVSWAVLATLVMARSNEINPERLRAVLAAVPTDHPLHTPLLTYIVSVLDLHIDELDRIGRQTLPEEWESAMGTIADEWLRQGRSEGRSEGRNEGLKEALLRLLNIRFGTVRPDDRSRVLAASQGQIDAWLATVLTADSVDGVLSEPAGD